MDASRSFEDNVQDEAFMREALAVARQGSSDPSTSPIGCVIVLGGRIIASARNQVAERCDPTAHAEINAIRAATSGRGVPELRGSVLYSTLQPCGMCSMASIWAKVGRIVYGAGRAEVHRMYFEDRHFNTLDFIRDAYRDDLEIRGGVLAETCAQLYYRPDDTVPASEQGNI